MSARAIPISTATFEGTFNDSGASDPHGGFVVLEFTDGRGGLGSISPAVRFSITRAAAEKLAADILKNT